MFDDQRNRLLNALDESYEAYHEAAIFNGPSVYFHLRSLEAARAKELDAFAECAYAMLASWGMHRMGPGGSKMKEFEIFKSSLKAVWERALLLQEKTPADISDGDWKTLKEIFEEIKCMESGTSLVGNSKVMAHLLPNLVPPVDRQYTLQFLFGNGRIKNGSEEWTMLKKALDHFFYPVFRDPRFQAKAVKWRADKNRSNWDTSDLKIVDNLLIGLLKKDRSKKQKSVPVKSV